MQPSKLWKNLPIERRLAAADAFWRDEQGLDQQIEAVVTLAKRLNFRSRSLQALPIERKAKMLAQAPDVSDTVAARALVAYHFANERPLMAAFLDALGITHEDGLIADEQVAAPDRARLEHAIGDVRSKFPAEAVDLYLRTLVAIDGDTWGGIDELLSVSR
jgi:hypothetical protein